MTASPDDPTTCDTVALNSLLQGELSAVDTYTQAMGQFDDQSLIAGLQKIRDEHSRAARELRDRVVAFGATPAESPGAWSTFTVAVSGSAEPLGPATVIAALRQGEEHGAGAYEDALENEHIHPDCHRLIRGDLLVACRKHVEALNRLLGSGPN